MNDITQLIQSGSVHVWFYVPVAVFLGALHGLEPGHSKTMMAAFIIAIRGTVWQAILLGLSAALSHSLIIWLLAFLALSYGSQWNAETTEPYFHFISAAMALGLAIWMLVRTRAEMAEAHAHAGTGAAQQHQDSTENRHVNPGEAVHADAQPQTQAERDLWQSHSHSQTAGHHDESGPASHVKGASGLVLPRSMVANPLVFKSLVASSASTPAPLKRGPHGGLLLDTGHGWLEVSIHSSGESSRFRIYPCRASGQPVPVPLKTQLRLETARISGELQQFQFENRESFWEATAELPQPHELLATITLGHSDHAHTYRLRFTGQTDAASQTPVAVEEIENDGVEYQDAHERAHAQDIARRFGNRPVTTSQIVLFGITGGLMPCPAAFTVLLVCLQIKRFTLGVSMVAAFSAGLALTMVTVGVIAAWGTKHASQKFKGFGNWMRRAPYISCALLVLLAAFMIWQGWQGLSGHLSHKH
jgi:nickel/cobalt exporter